MLRRIRARNSAGMKLIFYGRLADSIGPEIELEVPEGAPVAELRSRLDQRFPGNGFADGRIRACVAGAVVGEDALLRSDQPIEILAPVSGG